MDIQSLTAELDELVAEFGSRPLNFFSILQPSTNPILDIHHKNEQYAFVKSETWHSLDLSNYWLWSVTDNGDLLWWNGEQTIAMDHRASVFVSEPTGPRQFIRLVSMDRIGRVFPTFSVGKS